MINFRKAILVFIFSFIALTNAYAEIIKEIIHPKSIENTLIIPFVVKFSPSLKNGDSFIVISDENKVAMKVSVKGGYEVSEFSSRFKGSSTGNNVVVFRDGKVIDTKFFKFSISGSMLNIDQGKKPSSYKVKATSANDIKVLFSTEKGSQYLRKLDFSTPEGNISVDATPYASDDLFIGIVGNFDAEKFDIKAYSSKEKYKGNGEIEETEMFLLKNGEDSSITEFNVPSDSNSKYFILDKGNVKDPNNNNISIIITKRVGLNGLTYSARAYNCKENTVRYLATGDSMEAMKKSKINEEMSPIVKESIAYYIGIEACR